MSKEGEIKILIDADVLIHFVKGDHLSLLTDLFPNRMVILDRVLEELYIHKNDVSIAVDNLMRFGYLQRIPFPDRDLKVIADYAKLTKTKGKGESACLAYCRHHPHIIASSNLSDIREYCDENQLAFVTTMDILCIGLHKGKITEDECNAFIQKVLAAKSKLPNMKISDYRDAVFDRTKYLY